MRLTEIISIKFCKRMWTRFAKTGETKEDYKYTKKELEYCKPKGYSPRQDCWFCEYGKQRRKADDSACGYCPYYKRYGHCNETGSLYNKWLYARFPRTRKKYAKLFLEQIKAIPIKRSKRGMEAKLKTEGGKG